MHTYMAAIELFEDEEEFEVDRGFDQDYSLLFDSRSVGIWLNVCPGEPDKIVFLAVCMRGRMMANKTIPYPTLSAQFNYDVFAPVFFS